MHQNLFRLMAQISHPPLFPPKTVSIFPKEELVWAKELLLQQADWLFHYEQLISSTIRGMTSSGFGGRGFRSSPTMKAQSQLAIGTRENSNSPMRAIFIIRIILFK